MSKLFLKVWRVEQTCIFELTWGEGQQLTVQLTLLGTLLPLYSEWQKAYLNFYRSGLRARQGVSGGLKKPQVDWRIQLVQTEANLLADFHRWLKSAELAEIRQQIAQVAAQTREPGATADLFLSCMDPELARLPWETWEIGQEFAATGRIRIARSPSNIRTGNLQRCRQGRMRVLAIMGDDTGLSLQRDLETIASLSNLLDVEWVGWQQGKNPAVLKEEIQQAISHPQGWDILFFAGHSNESNLTGGELAIAPKQSIFLREIAPQLEEARQRGLKFALFNSCQGLSLAETLIDLGLSQVAVMREPIHNAVAQEFLVAFLRALANYEDVHSALYAANQFLKSERNMTYPSASLVPSLFRHPSSTPLKLEPFGWRHRVRKLLPTRGEAIVLGVFAMLSLLPPVKQVLLDGRMLTQAVYRNVTEQTDVSKEEPEALPEELRSLASTPVTLVRIDDDTIREDDISVKPRISRFYLARLVEKLHRLDVDTIGIDYLLDRASLPEQAKPNAALNRAILDAKDSRFVFAVYLSKDGKWLEPSPEIVPENREIHGDIEVLGLPTVLANTIEYGIADAAVAKSNNTADSGDKQQKPVFAYQLVRTKLGAKNHMLYESLAKPLEPGLLSYLSYWFYQAWLHPLIDYSIPPDQIYTPISAWKLLASQGQVESYLKDKIVMITPGGYGDAGVDQPGEDLSAALAATRYWWNQERLEALDWQQRQEITGGEIHAYQAHHLLNRAFIVPIPNLWLVLLVGAMAKYGRMHQFWQWKRRTLWLGCGIITVAYAGLTLQMYVSEQVLLPWLLPTATLWSYCFVDQRGKDNA